MAKEKLYRLKYGNHTKTEGEHRVRYEAGAILSLTEEELGAFGDKFERVKDGEPLNSHPEPVTIKPSNDTDSQIPVSNNGFAKKEEPIPKKTEKKRKNK